MPTTFRIIFLLSCATFLLLLSPMNAFAQTAQQPGLIAQGFKSDTTLPIGALVSSKENATDSVELSNTTNVERLVGVVSEQAFFEVSDATSTVQVVLEGTTPALVSDLNGEIKAGDRVTVSPIAGVGMKATQSSIVMGVAQSSLLSANTVTRTVTDQNGQDHTVNIGLVPVQINVAAYIVPEDSQQTGVPSVLQNIANTVAGRPVSALRVILAAVITLLLFCVIIALLYSAVRSSLISIGRNPLSERSLRKGVTQVGLVVLGITTIGLGIVYAILRL